MSDRVLIAGIGNIFLGDDAFGVEVVRALASRPYSGGICIKDFGIRGFDLAYALLDPWDAVILVDAAPRGEMPGTLYTLELDLQNSETPGSHEMALDPHGMDPVKVLRLAQSLGRITARVYLVGCEPADFGGEEGRMSLSEPVQSAVQEAVHVVQKLAADILESKPILAKA
jgi:hydrogenase maturation protease